MNWLHSGLVLTALMMAASGSASGQNLADLARLKDYTAERISSFDRAETMPTAITRIRSPPARRA